MWRRDGAETHTDTRPSCAGETMAELAEEMNGERGRQGERIENTAVGKKKKQKGAKGEGDNAGERIPGAYSARTLTHACACETRGMKGADVGIKFPDNATAVERRLS